MPEIQDKDAAPQQPAENAAVPTPAAEETSAAPAPAEEKHERLVESDLEAAHSDVLPLSPIEAPEDSASAPDEDRNRHGHGRRGLRRGNAGRGARRGNNAAQSVGIVENPEDAQETLSGKFVDGYEKDKEFRRAREQRRNRAEAAAAGAVPAAQGWCLTEPSDPTRHCHPQSNTNANRTKLIIEPAPIPEQEKDPSVWQRFKAKVLAIFGLDKKKKNRDKKKRRGGKYRNKHGKKFPGKGGDFRKGDRNGNQDFRGGNRRNRHNRGPRPGNSGARPQNNGGNGNPPAAAS